MTEADPSLHAYYTLRAREYERVYDKPERQDELSALRLTVAQYFTGRDVLEIACGTGWWTAAYAAVANSVLATDIGEEVLAIAREKALPGNRVVFARADAFAPRSLTGTFDACFIGFWWSHVSLDILPEFLRALHERLGSGARVMIIDNRFVAESNTPVHRVDERGNSYQLRKLADGSTHEVLKNFPDGETVTRFIAVSGGGDIDIQVTRHFWCATYLVRDTV